jgi:hypothetical protein
MDRRRGTLASRGIAATFSVADALQLHRLGQTFQSVLDCGLFHTLDDDERPTYVNSLAAATAPASVLHLLCFNNLAPGSGGPRRISQIRTPRVIPRRLESRLDRGGSHKHHIRFQRRPSLAGQDRTGLIHRAACSPSNQSRAAALQEVAAAACRDMPVEAAS